MNVFKLLDRSWDWLIGLQLSSVLNVFFNFVDADQRHQLAVRGDERPVRDGRQQGPPGGGGAAAAGDGDRGGRRRGRGGGGAVLLGVPAGLPGGRGRAEAPRVPARVPRALHRLLAPPARLLPALPPRHLNPRPPPGRRGLDSSSYGCYCGELVG